MVFEWMKGATGKGARARARASERKREIAMLFCWVGFFI